MITVDEALAIVLDHTPAAQIETVSLEHAVGRVLMADVRSDVDMPPFDRSAMDGYALRAADAAVSGVVMPVVGRIQAGQSSDLALGPGTAVQIMTGAPVPPGADAVLQVEKTESLDDGRSVRLLAAVERGANVVGRGTEVGNGQVVLRAGGTVHPADVGVLAAVGAARVAVGRRPTVAILSTGDELVGVDTRPGPGQIRNSNGYAVAAQARLAGATVVSQAVATDETAVLRAAIASGLDADVLVISGGVSVGLFDLVEDVLESLGVELRFTKVAIKPGAPLVFGKRGSTLVFGLPGNPVSAQVTFDVFVRAALLRRQGCRAVQRPTLRVTLGTPLRNRSGRRNYLPVRLRREDGALTAHAVQTMGSGDLTAHARANALVILENDRLSADAGELAPALLLGNFLERDGEE